LEYPIGKKAYLCGVITDAFLVWPRVVGHGRESGVTLTFHLKKQKNGSVVGR